MNCSLPTFPDLDYEPVGIGKLANLTAGGRIVFAAVCALFSLYAIVSNVFVIFAIYSYKPLRTKSSNLWLVSLAVTDIIVAVFAAPIVIYYNLFGAWSLGKSACRVRG